MLQQKILEIVLPIGPLIINMWILGTNQGDTGRLFDRGLEYSEDTNSIVKLCFDMNIEINIHEPLVNKILIYCQTGIPFIGKRQIYRN